MEPFVCESDSHLSVENAHYKYQGKISIFLVIKLKKNENKSY